jgi:hypothetical protein
MSSTTGTILAYMNSPEGKAAFAAQQAREARFPRITVEVPEGLAGQFTEEFEFLAAKGSPWVQDCGEASEAALVQQMVLARECALRLSPAACQELYAEKGRLAYQGVHQRPLTDEQVDRLHELNVITNNHPISMNLDIVMLVVDPRLDSCGYPAARWLPAYIEGELAAWRSEVDHPYGTPWVDAAL